MVSPLLVSLEVHCLSFREYKDPYIRVADAALMMQLGCDGVFVGSGIFHVSQYGRLFVHSQTYSYFQSGDPAKRARAIVQAVTHFNNPKLLAEVSESLGPAMVGLTM